MRPSFLLFGVYCLLFCVLGTPCLLMATASDFTWKKSFQTPSWDEESFDPSETDQINVLQKDSASQEEELLSHSNDQDSFDPSETDQINVLQKDSASQEEESL